MESPRNPYLTHCSNLGDSKTQPWLNFCKIVPFYRSGALLKLSESTKNPLLKLPESTLREVADSPYQRYGELMSCLWKILWRLPVSLVRRIAYSSYWWYVESATPRITGIRKIDESPYQCYGECPTFCISHLFIYFLSCNLTITGFWAENLTQLHQLPL